jgi:hypothetical protein
MKYIIYEEIKYCMNLTIIAKNSDYCNIINGKRYKEINLVSNESNGLEGVFLFFLQYSFSYCGAEDLYSEYFYTHTIVPLQK